MKKIVACYKWVVDEADIRVEGKERALNFDRVKYKISEYDRNAIEAGALLMSNKAAIFLLHLWGKCRSSLKDVFHEAPKALVM